MDVLQNTLDHMSEVKDLLDNCAERLRIRGEHHDESKLVSPEKEMFERWRPMLDKYSVDSPEYKDILAQMGEGLKHHYAENRHHPEHFKKGVYGMNLFDLIEMICDWKASASRKGETVNMEWAVNRFMILPKSDLYCIILNTLKELE